MSVPPSWPLHVLTFQQLLWPGHGRNQYPNDDVAIGVNPVALHTGRNDRVHGSDGVVVTGAYVGGAGVGWLIGACVDRHDGRSRHRRRPPDKSGL
jgi:hypothetical protein